LGAKIAKERGKQVERTVGYDNDEDALRLEFRSHTELDELETAGCCVDSGRHSQREQPREHGVNPGALVGAAQFQGPRDPVSQVEETHREDS